MEHTPEPEHTPPCDDTPKGWQDYIDWESPLTESSVWQAIADANDLDYSEIADGDLADWL